jgi:hypothetical protein
MCPLANYVVPLLLLLVPADPVWNTRTGPQTDPCFCLDAGGVWYSLPDICCHLPDRHPLDDMDGTVDIRDLLELLAHWGECPPPASCCGCDIDRDGWCDVSDLLLILEHWGQHPRYFERCRELP